jgi:hypothetical protein
MRPDRWIAMACLAVVAGCATTWDVDSFEAPESDIAARRSFAWKPGELGSASGVQPKLVKATESGVRGVVTSGLTRKGYVEAATGAAADMIVTYQVAGTQRFVLSDERRIGAPSPTEVLSPSGPPLPPASDLPREQSVRDGSVIVFVEDPASGRLIWRGRIQAEVRVDSAEAGVRMLEEMTRRIMEEFPARRAKP